MGENKLIYCPYTDGVLDIKLTKPEHIIPLALGGSNQFTLPVDEAKNKELGTELDGKIANDFLIKCRRITSDTRGHSNKNVKVTFKKAVTKLTNAPIQLTLGQGGFKIYDPIAQQEPVESVGEIFVERPVDSFTDLYIPFIAKVALASGYFIYHELFRHHVRHEALRFVMNEMRRNVQLDPDIIQKMNIGFGDCLEREHQDVQIFIKFCELHPNSTVIFIAPTDCSIIFFVTILGQYLGFLHVPAKTINFPNEGEYEGGVAIILNKRIMQKISMRSAHNMLKSHIDAQTKEGSYAEQI